MFYASLTILQAHPQLFVVFLLHVVDDLTLVLQGIGLLDAGHEVSLNNRVGQAVEQVMIWKTLTHNHRTKYLFRASLLFCATKGAGDNQNIAVDKQPSLFVVCARIVVGLSKAIW